MKRVFIVLLSFIFLVLIGKLFNLHIYPTGTIPGNVVAIQTLNIKNGVAILFENQKSNTFGIAKVMKFGPIYYYYGGTDSHELEEGMPFSVAGYGRTRGDFLVAVKVPTGSHIKYISLGNHLEVGNPSNETISLDIVKQHPDCYLVKKVEGNYVFFLTDGYSEESWTVRAFDENGKLVADKLFGSQPRFLQ